MESKKGSSKQPKEKEGKKERLRRSEQVYNQIKWSGLLPAEEFIIGYIDRFRGMIERPLIGWCEDSTDTKNHIPWHRVWYIKHNDVTVWDRENRIDLLKNVAEYLNPSVIPAVAPSTKQASAAAGPSTSSPSSFESKNTTEFKQPYWDSQPAYVFDHKNSIWTPLSASSQRPALPAPAQLTVLTQNILSDVHQADLIYTDKRLPVLFERICALNPDIIAFQEVQRSFLSELLQQDWVKARYYVSDSDLAKTLPSRQGQVLLSRYPINSIRVYHFGPHKHFLLASCQVSSEGTPLKIGVCHLTSDHASNPTAKRKAQLDVIWETHPDLLIGDFNFGDDDPSNYQLPLTHADVYRTLHPHDAGNTFVPSQNTLAAITTQSYVDRRLDRILAVPDLTPLSAELFGVEPFFIEEGNTEPLFVSDHYGVVASLRPN